MGPDGAVRERTQIGPFFSYNVIPASFQTTLQRLVPFYQKRDNLVALRNLVERTDPASPPMRLLDWLVTNFSKEQPRIIEIRDAKNCLVKYFDIHTEYKKQRGEYKKRLFDCFAKRLRICYSIDGSIFTTTVAQANFIHWAITNKIIDYAIMFKDEINEHMNKMKNKRVIEKKSGIVTKQRSSLSKRAVVDDIYSLRPTKMQRAEERVEEERAEEASDPSARASADSLGSESDSSDSDSECEAIFECSFDPGDEM